MSLRPRALLSPLSRLLSAPLLVAGLVGLGLTRGSTAEPGWHREDGYQWRTLSVPAQGKPGFTRLNGTETGVLFTNTLTEWSGAMNRVLYNGSGVAIGDYDHDSLPDIYFCGLNSTNALFRNLGDWKFEQVPGAAGALPPEPFCRGACFADINGDGWDDLLVTTLADGVRCYLNDKQGQFVDVSVKAGTLSQLGASSVTLADVDGNGTLDLYVANYRSDDIRDQGEVQLSVRQGQIQIPPQYRNRLKVEGATLFEFGQADQLLLNDGKGNFRAADWTDGTFLDEAGNPLQEIPLDWGLTASFRDVNDDRLPDLYVCNDYWSPDRFWINQGNGQFRAIERLALRHTSASSMGMDFADYDRDGDVDLFVLDMLSRATHLRKRQQLAQQPMLSPIGVIDDRPQLMRNTLQENLGNTSFRDVAWQAGVAASDWSWSVLFLDVDLDGFEDLVIPAGHFKDVQDMDVNMLIQTRQKPRNRTLSPEQRRREFSQELLEHHRLYPRLDLPVVTFRNLGDGTFEEMTDKWGTAELGVHHSITMGDLDGDGDLDLITNNFESNAGVYRNDTIEDRVAVRLRGRSPNTRGIGASVRLFGGPVPMQSQEIVAGGRYLAGAEPILVFAAAHRSSMRLQVRWRTGHTTIINNVQPNRMYEVEEPESTAPVPEPNAPPSGPTTFQNASDRLSHRHHEPVFDDFTVQPLLPFKLSQAGPGVCWFDLDGDTHEDLIVGTGRGGPLSVFLGDATGEFHALPTTAVSWSAWDDVTGCVGYYPTPATPALLLGVSGREVPGRAAIVQATLENDRLHCQTVLTNVPQVLGPLALSDVDGDGDLDLFVGGGALPGRYPEAAASQIYRFTDGTWANDPENSQVVSSAGIVNGAVWSDLEGDGFAELILACEWGPVRVYRNERGQLTEITTDVGLSPYLGLWRGVTTGDLDGDGRLEIVASNWGNNSPFQADVRRPLRLIYGDFLDRGRYELIEMDYSTLTGELTPYRHFNALAPSLLFLYDRFPSFRQFSEASLAQTLGEYLPKAKATGATTLASTVFYAAGPRFRPVELPRAAQLAPAFAIDVRDLDNDGHEDLFLSQNFFATRLELPRIDAGQGLWLKGDGQGGFAEMPSSISGLQINGEQRGAATADFDRDGRVDLVVSQNGAETQLYRNQNTSPGIKVRLLGPERNPTGVGAVFRVRYPNGMGPAREIHAGSGYWSQSGSLQVVPSQPIPTGFSVRWPGGREQTSAFHPGASEVTIDFRETVGSSVSGAD